MTPASSVKQSQKVRCAAKTLARKPCKKYARSGSKYCWHHNLSRTEDCKWWENTFWQLLGLTLAVFGIGATVYYGCGGATKEQAAEISKDVKEQGSDIKELLAIAKRTVEQQGPDFAKEFPLGYQLFAFGKTEYAPFTTGRTDVFLKIPPDSGNYTLEMDDILVDLTLPTILLVTTNGNIGLAMTNTSIILPRQVGAECILNVNSAKYLTFDEFALAAGKDSGKLARQKFKSVLFSFAPEGGGMVLREHSPGGSFSRMAMAATNGVFWFSDKPDLSFVTKLVQTPTSGVVLVFGLKPFER